MKNIFYFIIACTLFIVGGCNDKYNFDGNDSYLLDFALKTPQGVTYQAIIDKDNNVRLNVDNEVDLNNSKVTFDISNQASIIPDPLNITNWNDEQVFNVISKNGTKRTYIVRIIKRTNHYDGDIVLKTDQDVINLSNKNISEIYGNLIIGSTTGKDSIHSIASLTNIKKVRHAIIINPTYKGKSLDGLRNIYEAGSIMINNEAIEDILLNNIHEVRKSISIQGKSIQRIVFPHLNTVEGNININANKVADLQIPNLKNVDGLSIQSDRLNIIELNELRSIGNKGINLEYLNNLYKLVLPKLTTIHGDFILKNNPILQVIKIENVTNISGNCEISKNDIHSLNFLKIKSIGKDLTISSDPKLEDIVMTSIENINGKVSLKSIPIKTLNNMPIKSAKGITISDLNSLTDIEDFFKAIKEVKENVEIDNIDLACSLDLRHLGLKYQENDKTIYGKVTIQNSPKIISIKLPENIQIEFNNQTEVVQNSPTIIEGSGTIDKFIYSGKVQTSDRYIIKGFTSIREIRLGFPFKTLEIPDLVEVGLNINNAINLSQIVMPKVKKIFKLYLNAGWGKSNNAMSNLNFCKHVEAIESLSIMGFRQLNDFGGLRKAVENKTFKKSFWGDLYDFNVMGCGYNPQYADLQKGKYTNN